MAIQTQFDFLDVQVCSNRTSSAVLVSLVKLYWFVDANQFTNFLGLICFVDRNEPWHSQLTAQAGHSYREDSFVNQRFKIITEGA